MSETAFTDQNFEEEVIKSDVPVLVDFSAIWCGPCQMMSPAIEELAKEMEGRAKVGKMDIDQSQKIPQKYGVMSVPTIMIFKNGEIAHKSVGLQTKDSLKAKLEELL